MGHGARFAVVSMWFGAADKAGYPPVCDQVLNISCRLWRSDVAERPRDASFIEYFAKLFKVTQGHSKWHRLIDRIRAPIGGP